MDPAVVNLSVDLAPTRPGSLVLRNPVLAAGAIGYGREFMRQVDLGTLGALVTRVTTLQRQPGAPPPRLVGTPAGVLIGQRAQPRPARRRCASTRPPGPRWPLPVILAVAGQSPAEYARIGGQVDGEPGVAGLELDLSAPPEPGHRPPGRAGGTRPRPGRRCTPCARPAPCRCWSSCRGVARPWWRWRGRPCWPAPTR